VKDRTAANPERRREITRGYYHRHVREIAEKVRLRNAAKPKKGKPEPKGRDPAKARLRNRKYAASHREQIKAKNRLWGLQNRDKTRENTRLWQRQNREKAQALVRNRRARKRGVDGSHTAEDTAKIRKMQKNKCAYCRIDLFSGGQLDHIVALASGGSNWPSNLQWLCSSCNKSKSAKDAIIFSRERGLLL
jgi:5-methylcytosine-specific restriction endonuclease McrA